MLQVECIPAFDDNYIWLLSEPGKPVCAVVDPGDEEPVISVLEQGGYRLSAILLTHKHYDHVGGVDGLKDRYPDAVVYGPGNEKIPQVEQTVSDGQQLAIPGMSLTFEIMEVPGHTEGHLAYFGHNALFCGDTLFAGGCGRVFSGTFKQLSASLDRIKQLPLDTMIYCAHEYTEANLGFAEWVEPENPVLQQRLADVGELRTMGKPTVPSTLMLELETNPFLRVTEKR